MKQQEEAKTPTLVERLRQVYEAEMRAANDCDGRPEHTANWQYACTVMEAINALSASQSSRQQIAEALERLTDAQKDQLVQTFFTYFALGTGFMEGPIVKDMYDERDMKGLRHGLDKTLAAFSVLIPAEVEGQREDV